MHSHRRTKESQERAVGELRHERGSLGDMVEEEGAGLGVEAFDDLLLLLEIAGVVVEVGVLEVVLTIGVIA